MQEVKIYTASPSDLSPPVQSESFCVDMVLASDYAALEARCAALASENALARNAVQAFCDVIGDNTEVISEEVGRDGVLVILEAMKATGNMPDTDAFLAEVTQEAVEPLKKEIEGLKKQLLMSVGDIRDLIDYNPENGVLTAKVNFSGRQAGSVIGSQTWQGYYAFSLFGKKCFAHRLAWLLHYGEWPSQPIDHINGIKTDNSIRNLRLCSLSQNQFNKPTQKNNTTGVKGVYWNKRDKRYVASVQFNGKKYSAGHHKDIDSAKEAVMKLREKLAGEFTNHGEFELAAQLRKGASL
ncbi:endonuclease [Salmonella enterica]|nr:endonuclease [Salmonella enterica subsp. enterica]EDB1632547.1 endonuclease [Salmonella enterica]EDN7225707.1 endonuclease [Salmonella enterica subsp. enterica]EDW1733112.1 endonuclease [Salmonella enterica subsp. enterica]EEC0894801.1 endonuclease [Salmonella enterica subsp. enterica serovar Koumra]